MQKLGTESKKGTVPMRKSSLLMPKGDSPLRGLSPKGRFVSELHPAAIHGLPRVPSGRPGLIALRKSPRRLRFRGSAARLPPNGGA